MPKYVCEECGKIVIRDADIMFRYNTERKSFCEKMGKMASLIRLRIHRKRKGNK